MKPEDEKKGRPSNGNGNVNRGMWCTKEAKEISGESNSRKLGKGEQLDSEAQHRHECFLSPSNESDRGLK